MPHHLERFGTAMSVLAGQGHIKKRLIKAYEDNLSELDEAALPQTARDAFAELRSRMTAVAPLNGEGAIFASIRKMSLRDADECAQLILGMYVELLKNGALPAAADEKTKPVDVPALLLKSV